MPLSYFLPSHYFIPQQRRSFRVSFGAIVVFRKGKFSFPDSFSAMLWLQLLLLRGAKTAPSSDEETTYLSARNGNDRGVVFGPKPMVFQTNNTNVVQCDVNPELASQISFRLTRTNMTLLVAYHPFSPQIFAPALLHQASQHGHTRL